MRTNDKITIAVLVALSSGRAVAGDVVFDGTTGAAGNALFDSATNTFSIREQDGTLANRNLFHSFSTFNIDVAETAEFTATSAVDNVISRVTSLQPTTIDGTVRSLIPNANFWFINPAGITVGATGVIDVQGAIALGSADFVEFQNGLQWRALNNGGSAASALLVNPTDFGFLPGSTAGALSVTDQSFAATAAGEPQANGRSFLLTGGAGVEVVSSGSLFLEDGKIETARGGNVLVAGAGVELRNTQIYAPRGRVGIASVADPSTLVLDDNAEFVFADVPRESLRSIRFNDYEYGPGQVIHPFFGNIINTSSDSFVGGGVYLLGGEIRLRSTLINSDSLQGSPADVAAGGVHVRGESLDINRNTSLTSVVRGDEDFFTADDDGIPAAGPAEGDGGPIDVRLYGDLTVSGTEDQVFDGGRNFRTSISTQTLNSGDGGDIRISAANVTIEGPQTLLSQPPTEADLARGGPGTGFIASSNDALDRDDEQSRAAATGNAGDIAIAVSGTVRLRGLGWSQGADPTDPDGVEITGAVGAQIASGTQHIGLLDDGAGNEVGTAGDITITAASLEIEDAGQISSGTDGTARGGDIDITLTGGHLSLSTDPNATFTSGVFTRARSEVDNPLRGTAGDITIAVTASDPTEGWVSLSGTGQNGLGSRLFSDAISAQGNAGAISVEASGAISLTGASVRTDVANNEEATAGDITLRSDTFVTIDSSLVSSQSTAANSAGTITVEGSGVLIHNRSQLLADYNNAGSNPGEPGSITITATATSTETQPQNNRDEAREGVVTIVDSGVNANNNGGRDDADRGDITILADDVVIAGSVISTDVVAGGVGDDIVIRGDRSVSLLRSDGQGFPVVGTVIPAVDPRSDIQRSLISARTQSSAAAGGLIRVQVGSGGTITVEDSNIDTSTSIDGSNVNPDRVVSNIALDATGGTVEASGAVLTTQTTGLDPAGNIQVRGDRIELRNTILQASTAGSGDAGSIEVSTGPGGSLLITDSGRLLSDASEGVPAFDFATGQILVKLPNAGTVAISAGTSGAIIDGSSLASSAGVDAGQAGTVSILSAGELSMTGSEVNTSAETARTSGPNGPLGAAAIVLQAAGAVSLTDTSLQSETFGALDAGSITVTGSQITVSGVDTSGRGIAASTRDNPDPTIAVTNAGDAGEVALTATVGSVRLLDGAVVSTSSEGTQAGQAGIITVTGNGVELQNATVTTAVGSNVGGLTPARIDLDATTGVLSLTGSIITAATTASADAGNINLDGAAISVSGGTITASTTSTGDAGDVAIIADDVELTDGALVETSALDEATSSTNLGDAGTIEVRGVNVTLADAALSTTTDSDILSDQPAFIYIRATEALSLTNSDLSSATTGAMSAGEVILDGDSTRVSGGTITASTTSTGHAGRVAIAAGEAGGDIELIDGAEVFSSSTGADSGQAGTIEINGGNITLAGANLRTSTESDVVATPAQIQIAGTGALTLTDTSISAETSGAIAAGSITLSGRSIAMTGGSLSTSAAGTDAADTNLGAAGKIQLVASNITLSGAGLSTSTDSDVIAATPAEIVLDASSTLALTDADLAAGTTGAASAGSIALNGASISMSDGAITASTTSTGAAGHVSINAAEDGDVELIDGAAVVSSSTGAASGAAGRIEVTGADVTLADSSLSTSTGSDITTVTPAEIAIEAAGALSLTRTDLSAATSGAADAGNITLAGSSIDLSGGTVSVATTAAGNAGNIALNAPNAVAVTSGATIKSSSEGLGSGAAGTIAVTGSSITLADAEVTTSIASSNSALTPAQIDLTTPGVLSLTRTMVSAATSADASAGNINLTGASISMNGGTVTARTTGAGDAGLVKVAATSGGVQVAGATIETSSQGIDSGAAGTIDIRGSQVSLANTGVRTSIESNVAGLSPAAITIAATGALSLTDGTDVDATTSGAAPGGSIVLTGDAILVDTSSVSSQTSGVGDAGSVCLAAGSTACAPQLSGRAQILAADVPGTGGITLASAELSTSTSGSGSAGNVDVHATGTLLLSNATLQSSSSATSEAGDGGSINLSSGFSDLLLIENSTVQTNAEAAEGGDITLDGGGSSIYLNNSVLFASAGANGNGGDVTMSNINQTLIEHSLILAQAVQGNGGSILLTLQDGATFLQDSSTLINADSQQGINGEVTINRPNTDLNSSILPQEVDVSKPAELGDNVCAPATPGARSTFVREGRGGVAESPDGYMTTLPASGAAPERTSASDKSVPVARTAARSSEESGTEKLTRGCL